MRLYSAPAIRSASLATIWGGRSGTYRGSACLALAGAAFVGIAALVQWLGSALPLIQIAAIQQIVVLAIVAPQVGIRRRAAMRTARPLLHLVRTVAVAAGILLGFYAVQRLPVVEVTAILFSRMGFTAVLAVLILGERVGPGTWAGVLLATAAVALVLSPDPGNLNVHGWAALGSALALSVTGVMTRIMRDESKEAIVGWQAIGLAALFTAIAWDAWVPLTAGQWLACAATGALFWIAQQMNVLAYRHGNAAAIQPAEASRLLVAIAVDVVIFGVFPDMPALTGAALIVLATWVSVAWGREAPGVVPGVVPGAARGETKDDEGARG